MKEYVKPELKYVLVALTRMVANSPTGEGVEVGGTGTPDAKRRRKGLWDSITENNSSMDTQSERNLW